MLNRPGLCRDPPKSYPIHSLKLAALRARSVRGTGLETAGDWALSFDGRGRFSREFKLEAVRLIKIGASRWPKLLAT